MKKYGYLALLAVSLLGANVPALAQSAKSATATSVKIGYFNLNLVKSVYPGSAESESLKNQAEAQLKNDVENANKNIQKLRDAKKSEEEVTKAVHDTQLSINAEQGALAKLIQGQVQVARERIYGAVNQVAKDKGLDIVIDADGLFAGGKTVLANGIDITQDLTKLLAPQLGTTSGGSSAPRESAPAAAAKKAPAAAQ
ncbi:MAG: OmpH family outer membrane protein [Candidatus Obscuribacterales bacterium]|nr:OmpH family outer membrane protein [Candidatus Obscuribacterales bacterium]